MNFSPFDVAERADNVRKSDKKEALFDCLSGISLMIAVMAAYSIDDEIIRQLSIVICIVIYLAICYFVEVIRRK